MTRRWWALNGVVMVREELAFVICWWLWLCCSFCSASRRLDMCTAEMWADIGSASRNGSGYGLGSGSGSGSGMGLDEIPAIVYFQTATRGNNTVRMNYAWSPVGFPTLFLSQSFDSLNCSNSFNVSESDYIMSQSFKSVNISGAGTNHSLAIVFHRLIEYNGGAKHYKASDGFDPSKAADFSYNTTYRSTFLNESMEWQYYPEHRSFVGRSSTVSLTIKLYIPTRQETIRIPSFPKTQYTENSTVFDIVIDNYNYRLSSKGNPSSRLALEMIMINGEQVDKASTDETVTEDDEYTPSVFRTREYYFQPKKIPSRGFLQWKPVSYQSKDRKSTVSQQANILFPQGEAISVLDGEVPRSLASALFSDDIQLNGTAMYIVIGNGGDETYVNSEYMTWTAVVGFGKVPREKISFLVIITIIVSLGIPAALMIPGGIYVTYKKKPWQNVARVCMYIRLRRTGGYEPLN